MMSAWRQVQHDLQQEKIDIARFVSEGGHDQMDAKTMAEREANYLRTGHDMPPRVHLSLGVDEKTMDVIRHDAEFQGISPQDLVRWLLDKYAEGELTAKHFPTI